WKENCFQLVPLLFAVFLLIVEMFTYKVFRINKSFFNPLQQALPLVLFVYGLGWIIAGKTAKILFTITLSAATFLTWLAVFTAIVFKLPLDSDIFAVLSASSSEESKEFFAVFANWKVFLSAALSCGILGTLLYFLWKNPCRRNKFVAVTGAVLMLPFVINCLRFTIKKEYIEICERNLETKLPVGYLVFKKNLDELVTMAVQPKLPPDIRRLSNKKIIGVLVLGESATRNHWGLYGYLRNTTPEMSRIKNDLLVFEDVISPWAVTTETCKMMFSTADFPSIQPLDFTVFSVLKKAGVDVICISNQYRWGKHDGPVNILYSPASVREFTQEQVRRAKDFVAIDRVKEYLSKTERPALIVVQLMGSHAAFRERYPENFRIFDGVRDKSNENFPARTAKLINEYDNSICYTDHLLGQVISMVRGLTTPGFVMYLSDHGEIPEIRGGRSTRSIHHSCYEIPLLFYGNNHYKKAFPEIMKAAAANVKKPYMTDHLDYAILSMLQVTYRDFPFEKDLFSTAFTGRQERLFSAQRKVYHKKEVSKPFVTNKKGVLTSVQ
ncbi:MAG: phosphoethanolamine transferase, partial [Lentisphaeria bacterium]|nr:phosphoethanolamine transferase [Lentisphaeria bacterium]